MALTNYQLGNNEEAQTEIKNGIQLLTSQPKKTIVNSTLARLFNNQGIIQLGIGNTEKAVASWDAAIVNYQKVADNLGVIRARLNQARALKTIGLYRRSLDSFEEIDRAWQNEPDSLLKISGLRSYGNLLRLTGKIDESRSILENSLEMAQRLSIADTSLKSPLAMEQTKTLLALGNTLVTLGDIKDRYNYRTALVSYQKAIALCQSENSCSNSDLPLQLNLAKLNLSLKTESVENPLALIKTIEEQIPEIALDRDTVDLKLSFADNLLKLERQKPDRISKSEIISLIQSAIADSQRLQYHKGESYGWGLQGQIEEDLARWDNADRSTNKALKIAQTIDAPEISYLWEWQLGRINRARGNRQIAIAHYQHSITLLNALSHDIASVSRQTTAKTQTEGIASKRQTEINYSLQHSFRDRVEPVYRQAVALMLDVAPGETVSQENLIKARDTIESLQLAELNNFFERDCVRGKSVALDSVDKGAAAIYPIILSDRLEIIVSLPDKHLSHYSVAISQTELENTIRQLRETVVIRSRRTFYQPATKLYELLITPILEDLTKHEIETLVFIPDGALRNIPLAALYDGKHYLIEQYNLVLNPGLQLLDPRPLQKTQLKTLAVGLTQKRGDFAPLEYVNLELATIKEQVKSQVLVDEQFTVKALQTEIAFSDYPIVHIATHGQFSSAIDNTFLLAWDDRIDLDRLERILQTRTYKDKIELLILSACETATGDKQATLGLAGIAIQAGARSTIATLWSINDRATAELMNTLYEKLATKSMSKAEAIRQAQLKLMRDRRYEHPFYWAAYTTIGNWL